MLIISVSTPPLNAQNVSCTLIQLIRVCKLSDRPMKRLLRSAAAPCSAFFASVLRPWCTVLDFSLQQDTVAVSSEQPARPAYTTSGRAEELFEDAWISKCNKAGVPKVKVSPRVINQRYHGGFHLKQLKLRLQPWYYCPLCAEPKRQGYYCRKEECRALKP